jgi:hypothetical protein
MLSIEYLNHEGFSASDVKSILKNGLDYYYAQKRGEVRFEKTDALTLGSYFHSLVLGDEAELEEYVVLDKTAESSNQKAFIHYVVSGEDPEKAYRCSYQTENKHPKKVMEECLALYEKLRPTIEAIKYGKTVVTREQVAKAEAMAEALTSKKEKAKKSVFFDLLSRPDAVKETPLFGSFDAVPIKGVPDVYFCDERTLLVSDLKTIEKAGVESCVKNIEEYKYLLSMYWYVWLIAQNHNVNLKSRKTKIRGTFMFVAKEPPYAITELEVDLSDVEQKLRPYIVALEKMLIFPDEPILLYDDYRKTANKRSGVVYPSLV